MGYKTKLEIGYFGERMDMKIRQGATLGPFLAQTFGPIDPDNNEHVEQEHGDPIDLTDCDIRGKIRKTALSEIVLAELVVDITDPEIGKYEFMLPDSVTALIPAGERITDPESISVWDLEMEDAAGHVIPLYFGSVFVLREVTRDNAT